jgi:hypothetical protein
MIQDERAKVGGETFDTLSVMGVDVETGDYFARTFENRGFCRNGSRRGTGYRSAIALRRAD